MLERACDALRCSAVRQRSRHPCVCCNTAWFILVYNGLQRLIMAEGLAGALEARQQHFGERAAADHLRYPRGALAVRTRCSCGAHAVLMRCSCGCARGTPRGLLTVSTHGVLP
jgi:hypothetical protein